MFGQIVKTGRLKNVYNNINGRSVMKTSYFFWILLRYVYIDIFSFMLKGQISTGKMFQKLIYIKNRHSALQYKLAQRRTQGGGHWEAAPPGTVKICGVFRPWRLLSPPPLGLDKEKNLTPSLEKFLSTPLNVLTPGVDKVNLLFIYLRCNIQGVPRNMTVGE